MTLQQIMYFQRVARSGSFTKAARACFVSQTAISRQICALEEELHVTLLERDTAHVKLTLAGEYFFQQVNELTAQLEEVVTRTQTIAQEQQTHLTLGIPTILEQHAISQLLRQYHSLHPEVQLSTVAGSRQQLVSQLVDRKIDLLVAMDFDLPDLEGLNSIILQQVHATWLLPTGHPLAGAEKIAPQQLQGETLILTQEDPRGNTEELLRQYYNQLGLKGNPVLHTRTLEELEQVDGRAAALKLILNKHGTITPYGVVYDNGMELEKFYKEGGPFPDYLDREFVILLEASYGEGLQAG